MIDKNYTGLIPEQEEGKTITAEHSVVLDSETDAQLLYNQAKERLLHVQNWGNLAGDLSANFQLTDKNGNELERPTAKGDHFKIDIKGPGTKAGEGYDWVRVEDVKEYHQDNVDSIAITVRPAPNPQTPDPDTAHFYSEKSTSTFVITREANKVSASIYDRNIKANLESKNIIDKIRNALVGTGAKHGFSKVQWEALAQALVKG